MSMLTIIMKIITQTIVVCSDDYNIFEEIQFKKTRNKKIEKRFVHFDDTFPRDNSELSENSTHKSKKNIRSHISDNYSEDDLPNSNQFSSHETHRLILNTLLNSSKNQNLILFGFLEVNMFLPFSPNDKFCFISKYFHGLLESFSNNQVDYYSLNWIVNEINRHFYFLKDNIYEEDTTNESVYEQPFAFYTIDDIERILSYYQGIDFDFLDKYTPYTSNYVIINNIDINMREVYLIYLSKLINYIKIKTKLKIPDNYVSHKIVFMNQESGIAIGLSPNETNGSSREYYVKNSNIRNSCESGHSNKIQKTENFCSQGSQTTKEVNTIVYKNQIIPSDSNDRPTRYPPFNCKNSNNSLNNSTILNNDKSNSNNMPYKMDKDNKYGCTGVIGKRLSNKNSFNVLSVSNGAIINKETATNQYEKPDESNSRQNVTRKNIFCSTIERKERDPKQTTNRKTSINNEPDHEMTLLKNKNNEPVNMYPITNNQEDISNKNISTDSTSADVINQTFRPNSEIMMIAEEFCVYNKPTNDKKVDSNTEFMISKTRITESSKNLKSGLDECIDVKTMNNERNNHSTDSETINTFSINDIETKIQFLDRDTNNMNVKNNTFLDDIGEIPLSNDEMINRQSSPNFNTAVNISSKPNTNTQNKHSSSNEALITTKNKRPINNHKVSIGVNRSTTKNKKSIPDNDSRILHRNKLFGKGTLNESYDLQTTKPNSELIADKTRSEQIDIIPFEEILQQSKKQSNINPVFKNIEKLENNFGVSDLNNNTMYHESEKPFYNIKPAESDTIKIRSSNDQDSTLAFNNDKILNSRICRDAQNVIEQEEKDRNMKKNETGYNESIHKCSEAIGLKMKNIVPLKEKVYGDIKTKSKRSNERGMEIEHLTHDKKNIDKDKIVPEENIISVHNSVPFKDSNIPFMEIKEDVIIPSVVNNEHKQYYDSNDSRKVPNIINDPSLENIASQSIDISDTTNGRNKCKNKTLLEENGKTELSKKQTPQNFLNDFADEKLIKNIHEQISNKLEFLPESKKKSNLSRSVNVIPDNKNIFADNIKNEHIEINEASIFPTVKNSEQSRIDVISYLENSHNRDINMSNILDFEDKRLNDVFTENDKKSSSRAVEIEYIKKQNGFENLDDLQDSRSPQHDSLPPSTKTLTPKIDFQSSHKETKHTNSKVKPTEIKKDHSLEIINDSSSSHLDMKIYQDFDNTIKPEEVFDTRDIITNNSFFIVDTQLPITHLSSNMNKNTIPVNEHRSSEKKGLNSSNDKVDIHFDSPENSIQLASSEESITPGSKTQITNNILQNDTIIPTLKSEEVNMSELNVDNSIDHCAYKEHVNLSLANDFEGKEHPSKHDTEDVFGKINEKNQNINKKPLVFIKSKQKIPIAEEMIIPTKTSRYCCGTKNINEFVVNCDSNQSKINPFVLSGNITTNDEKYIESSAKPNTYTVEKDNSAKTNSNENDVCEKNSSNGKRHECESNNHEISKKSSFEKLKIEETKNKIFSNEEGNDVILSNENSLNSQKNFKCEEIEKDLKANKMNSGDTSFNDVYIPLTNLSPTMIDTMSITSNTSVLKNIGSIESQIYNNVIKDYSDSINSSIPFNTDINTSDADDFDVLKDYCNSTDGEISVYKRDSEHSTNEIIKSSDNVLGGIIEPIDSSTMPEIIIKRAGNVTSDEIFPKNNILSKNKSKSLSINEDYSLFTDNSCDLKAYNENNGYLEDYNCMNNVDAFNLSTCGITVENFKMPKNQTNSSTDNQEFIIGQTPNTITHTGVVFDDVKDNNTKKQTTKSTHASLIDIEEPVLDQDPISTIDLTPDDFETLGIEEESNYVFSSKSIDLITKLRENGLTNEADIENKANNIIQENRKSLYEKNDLKDSNISLDNLQEHSTETVEFVKNQSSTPLIDDCNESDSLNNHVLKIMQNRNFTTNEKNPFSKDDELQCTSEKNYDEELILKSCGKNTVNDNDILDVANMCETNMLSQDNMEYSDKELVVKSNKSRDIASKMSIGHSDLSTIPVSLETEAQITSSTMINTSKTLKSTIPKDINIIEGFNTEKRPNNCANNSFTNYVETNDIEKRKQFIKQNYENNMDHSNDDDQNTKINSQGFKKDDQKNDTSDVLLNLTQPIDLEDEKNNIHHFILNTNSSNSERSSIILDDAIIIDDKLRENSNKSPPMIDQSIEIKLCDNEYIFDLENKSLLISCKEAKLIYEFPNQEIVDEIVCENTTKTIASINEEIGGSYNRNNETQNINEIEKRNEEDISSKNCVPKINKSKLKNITESYSPLKHTSENKTDTVFMTSKSIVKELGNLEIIDSLHKNINDNLETDFTERNSLKDKDILDIEKNFVIDGICGDHMSNTMPYNSGSVIDMDNLSVFDDTLIFDECPLIERPISLANPSKDTKNTVSNRSNISILNTENDIIIESNINEQTNRCENEKNTNYHKERSACPSKDLPIDLEIIIKEIQLLSDTQFKQITIADKLFTAPTNHLKVPLKSDHIHEIEVNEAVSIPQNDSIDLSGVSHIKKKLNTVYMTTLKNKEDDTNELRNDEYIPFKTIKDCRNDDHNSNSLLECPTVINTNEENSGTKKDNTAGILEEGTTESDDTSDNIRTPVIFNPIQFSNKSPVLSDNVIQICNNTEPIIFTGTRDRINENTPSLLTNEHTTSVSTSLIFPQVLKVEHFNNVEEDTTRCKIVKETILESTEKRSVDFNEGSALNDFNNQQEQASDIIKSKKLINELQNQDLSEKNVMISTDHMVLRSTKKPLNESSQDMKKFILSNPEGYCYTEIFGKEYTNLTKDGNRGDHETEKQRKNGQGIECSAEEVFQIFEDKSLRINSNDDKDEACEIENKSEVSKESDECFTEEIFDDEYTLPKLNSDGNSWISVMEKQEDDVSDCPTEEVFEIFDDEYINLNNKGNNVIKKQQESEYDISNEATRDLLEIVDTQRNLCECTSTNKEKDLFPAYNDCIKEINEHMDTILLYSPEQQNLSDRNNFKFVNEANMYESNFSINNMTQDFKDTQAPSNSVKGADSEPYDIEQDNYHNPLMNCKYESTKSSSLKKDPLENQPKTTTQVVPEQVNILNKDKSYSDYFTSPCINQSFRENQNSINLSDKFVAFERRLSEGNTNFFNNSSHVYEDIVSSTSTTETFNERTKSFETNNIFTNSFNEAKSIKNLLNETTIVESQEILTPTDFHVNLEQDCNHSISSTGNLTKENNSSRLTKNIKTEPKKDPETLKKSHYDWGINCTSFEKKSPELINSPKIQSNINKTNSSNELMYSLLKNIRSPDSLPKISEVKIISNSDTILKRPCISDTEINNLEKVIVRTKQARSELSLPNIVYDEARYLNTHVKDEGSSSESLNRGSLEVNNETLITEASVNNELHPSAHSTVDKTEHPNFNVLNSKPDEYLSQNDSHIFNPQISTAISNENDFIESKRLVSQPSDKLPLPSTSINCSNVLQTRTQKLKDFNENSEDETSKYLPIGSDVVIKETASNNKPIKTNIIDFANEENPLKNSDNQSKIKHIVFREKREYTDTINSLEKIKSKLDYCSEKNRKKASYQKIRVSRMNTIDSEANNHGEDHTLSVKINRKQNVLSNTRANRILKEYPKNTKKGDGDEYKNTESNIQNIEKQSLQQTALRKETKKKTHFEENVTNKYQEKRYIENPPKQLVNHTLQTYRINTKPRLQEDLLQTDRINTKSERKPRLKEYLLQTDSIADNYGNSNHGHKSVLEDKSTEPGKNQLLKEYILQTDKIEENADQTRNNETKNKEKTEFKNSEKQENTDNKTTANDNQNKSRPKKLWKSFCCCF